jgi:soluble lytic murein transglycosylase-like protein
MVGKITSLQEKVSKLESKIEILQSKVAQHGLLIRVMTSGASKTNAEAVINASKMYNVSPVVLTALIQSESSFRFRKHDLPYVIGLCGINTKVWTDLPHNPHTDSGNIHCSAYILRHYLDKSDGDYEEAVTRYKGYSRLGMAQAKRVMASIR